MDKTEKEVERVKLEIEQKRFLFWGNLSVLLFSFLMPLISIDENVGYDYLYRAQETGNYSLITICFLFVITACFFVICSFFEKDLTKKYRISRTSLIFLLLASFVYTIFGFICVREQGEMFTFAPTSIVFCLFLTYVFESWGGGNERLREALEKEEVD